MTSNKFLLINADDLGASRSVNQSIARACREGILRSASLMAGGAAFEEAAAMAKELPLSAGIHITLCDGRPVLKPSEIPGLVDKQGFFEQDPARAGINYWLRRKRLSGQLEAEIEAQFRKLEDAGLKPLHADSHHHLHVHPVIFRILCRVAARHGVKWIRIPPGPFAASFALAGSTGIPEWAVFRALRVFNLRHARAAGLQTACTYGISRPGQVSADYLIRLISRIDGPVAEIFAHPDLSGPGKTELEALISPAVREIALDRGFTITGFEDIGKK